MNSVFIFILQLSAAITTNTDSRIEIEVNEVSDEFRVIVLSEKPLRFNAYQLEAPHSNFPPASAGVLVKQSAGNVVGCHEDNQPSHVVELSSSSRSARDKKMVTVKKGKPYVTPWYPSQTLFYFFDECVNNFVNPSASYGYAKYQILVDIETNHGILAAKTGWLDFHGFGTSGWGKMRSRGN